MNSDMLSTATEAAKALLSTMLGDAAPLKFSKLHIPDTDELRDDVRSLLGISPSDGRFAVLLDPEWLPLIAGLKLGVQTRVGDEDYEEIVRELGGHFVSAIQSHFSAGGTEIAVGDISVKAPGADLADTTLERTTSRLPFFMEWEGAILHGFVLVDPEDAQDFENDAETEVTTTPLPEMPASEPEDRPGAPPSQTTPAPAASATPAGVRIQAAAFPDLGTEVVSDTGSARLGLLAGVELEVTVELGRRRMPLSEILRLTSGSVLELEKLVGEPLQVFANNRFIAEGEAVVIDEQFGVRITALAARGAEKLVR